MANKHIYDDMITPVLMLWMSRSGLTNKEIAAQIGCAEKTLYNWQIKHEKVKAALRAGRDYFDATVENALYKNALGYKTRSVVEKEEVILEGEMAGQMRIVERVTTIIEHPGNVVAQIFWQKNRRPKDWKDKHDVDITGEIHIPLPPPPEQAYPPCEMCNGTGLIEGEKCAHCGGDGYVDPT